MPTYGWIQDLVEEHYWQVRDNDRVHTVALPRTLTCPLCDRTFTEDADRMLHIGLEHPISLPAISIRGRLLGSDTRVRARLPASDVGVANVTYVDAEVNGRDSTSWGPDLVPQRLADLSDGIVRLALTNERGEDGRTVTTEVTIRFEVPSVDDLNAVDEAFIMYAAVPDLTMRDISRFSQATEDCASAGGYRDALFHYAVGILAKDQRPEAGGTVPFEEYPARYQRALEVLVDYAERPVAAAVAGAIRFAINDLRDETRPTGIAELDRCTAFFRGLAMRAADAPPSDPTPAEPGVAPLCPVDIATHEVLQAFSAVWDRRDAASLEHLINRTGHGSLAAYDRSKCTALAAAALYRDGERAAAAPLLAAIAHDHVFGDWATHRLRA